MGGIQAREFSPQFSRSEVITMIQLDSHPSDLHKQTEEFLIKFGTTLFFLSCLLLPYMAKLLCFLVGSSNFFLTCKKLEFN